MNDRTDLYQIEPGDLLEWRDTLNERWFILALSNEPNQLFLEVDMEDNTFGIEKRSALATHFYTNLWIKHE